MKGGWKIKVKFHNIPAMLMPVKNPGSGSRTFHGGTAGVLLRTISAVRSLCHALKVIRMRKRGLAKTFLLSTRAEICKSVALLFRATAFMPNYHIGVHVK